MSDSVAFQAQLGAIIDVLAKSAVLEIGKLVDDGYAQMRLEVSQSHKQNETLKMRLRMMERRVAQVLSQLDRAGVQEDFVNHRPGVHCFGKSKKITEDYFPAERGPFGKGVSLTPWSDGELAAGHDEHSLGQPDVMSPVQAVEVEEPTPELSFIKKEILEEDLSNVFPPGGVEWRAGSRERRPVQEAQNKAANHTEELTEQHRTRHSVWEVSGLESVLKAEGQSECVETLQHSGTDHRAEGLSSLDSEFVMFERACQLGSYCTQENVGVGGENPTEMNSEPQLVHITQGAVEKSQSSSVSQDDKPEVVVIDSVPVKMEDPEQTQTLWNMASHSGMLEMDQSSLCAPYAAVAVGENMLPHTDPPDLNGPVSNEKSLFPSERPTAAGALGTRKERHVSKYCGKSCSRASDLKVHQRVHTGEKPFSCAQCGKRFSQSCSLKKHQTVHSGEKPFRCLQCGKQFSDSSNLRKHRSIHTGERPFSCSLCGKRFKQSCYLKTHLRIHTRAKSVCCAYCRNTFSSENRLKLHQLKNHMAPYSAL